MAAIWFHPEMTSHYDTSQLVFYIYGWNQYHNISKSDLYGNNMQKPHETNKQVTHQPWLCTHVNQEL